MTEQDRLELNAMHSGEYKGPPKQEHEHFVVCEHCGQSFDMRKLGDVFWHDQASHEPIKENRA